MSASKEDVLSWEFELKYAISELKRIGGCVPLSYGAEDEACEILAKFKKERYGVVDIFRAMLLSGKKHKEKIDTPMLRRSVPYSRLELDRIFEQASKNK